jgi:hypothetical protein
MERLKEKPETVAFNTSDGQTAYVTFTADYLAAEIRYMMKDAGQSIRLPLLIHRAYQDHDLQAFDPAAVEELGRESFLGGWDLYLAQGTELSCKYTPVGITPEGQTTQPGSQIPVLIWNGTWDPIDPPENMAGAKELWPNSVAVFAPFVSHNWHNPVVTDCWFMLMNDFIQAGSADGLQTGCLEDIRPPSFLLP